MRQRVKLRKIATAAVVAVLMCGTAWADIRAFNAAMQVKDYKQATAEAASTWASLDKTRPDLAVIAREFGMAAYLAGDYAAARSYGEAAVAKGETVNEGKSEKIASEVLLRISEHQLTPSDATRDKLFAALQASATLPGIDLLSYLGATAMVSYDIEQGHWRSARTSAGLAEKLTGQGGQGYASSNLQFAMIAAVSAFSLKRDVAAFERVDAVYARIVGAINTAPTAERAAGLVQTYWDLYAWGTSAETFLAENRQFKLYKARVGPDPVIDYTTPGGKLIARQDPNACIAVVADGSPRPIFPPYAAMKGMIGAVILKLDIAADGRVLDADVLAAAPARYFGDSAIKSALQMKFMAGETSLPGCSLAQTDRIFTFVFQLRER